MDPLLQNIESDKIILFRGDADDLFPVKCIADKVAFFSKAKDATCEEIESGYVEKIYHYTHFTTEIDAWKSILSSAKTNADAALRRVERITLELKSATEDLNRRIARERRIMSNAPIETFNNSEKETLKNERETPLSKEFRERNELNLRQNVRHCYCSDCSSIWVIPFIELPPKCIKCGRDNVSFV